MGKTGPKSPISALGNDPLYGVATDNKMINTGQYRDHLVGQLTNDSGVKSYHAVFLWWYSAKINCSKLSGHLYLWSRFVCTQLHILIQQIQIIWDVNHPYTIDMSTIHILLWCQQISQIFAQETGLPWLCPVVA